MPLPTGVIDTVATPPFALLNPVRDTNGPYGYGDHTLVNFHTDGAFLLPAGNYDIGGTYGVIVDFNGTIPPYLGSSIGWSDPLSFPKGDRYERRFCQLVLEHYLPIGGAWVPVMVEDVPFLTMFFSWPVLIGSGGRLGLHVEPGCSVNLRFMCLL
jgi:hypothetical protein